MGEIREPIKKHSIAKKNKIIKDGFKLMCDKGYHNVSSVDIAREAGVSTGIIYQYFKDKRSIFIEGAHLYASKIMFPMLNVLEKEKISNDNLKEMIGKMIEESIKGHKRNKKAHGELLSMSQLDEEVAKILKNNEIMVTNKVVNILSANGFSNDNLKEKVHLTINMIDLLTHEIVYHKHSNFDYSVMTSNVIDLIMHLFSRNILSNN